MKKNSGWIAVDLDGTLAYYTKFQGIAHIGAPIPKMVARVKKWLDDGYRVAIFTARASRLDHPTDYLIATKYVEEWAERYIGRQLLVTAEKSSKFIAFYDDRAIGVEKNTGELKSESHEEWKR